MNEREELERLRRQKRLKELEAREQASAPQPTMAQQEASALGMESVGTYNDGTIYNAPDGSRQFVSPGYSTSDPQAIDNMMAGRRPHRDEIGMVEGLARAANQGQSLYVGDEASSGTAAMLDKVTGKTPSVFRPPIADPNNPNGPLVPDPSPPTMGELNSLYLSRERDKIANFAKENPNSALAAELVGSFIPGIGMAGLGEKLIKGGSRLKRTLGAGLEGSIFGTAAAFNAGEGGYENRTVDGVTGGTLGLFAGAGGSVLFNAGGKGWDRLRRSLAARVGTAEGRAEAQMARAMADAGMTPEQITARLQELGPEAVYMDALGEPGLGLARSAANNSGVARDKLKEMSATRMAGQPDRLTDTLLDASGLDEPRTLDELVNASRDVARPGITAAYKEASAAGNDIDLNLFSDITQTRIGKEAFEEGMAAAKDRMRGNGEPSPLDVLDEAKKYLDSYAQPSPGMRQTPKQQFAGELASDIRTRTDQLLDEYEGARGLAQSQFKREEAFGLGADAAKPRVAADLARRVAADEGANADAIAQGYASGKIDQLQNRRTTAGTVDALFGPRRQQAALETALGPKAGPVKNQIEAERIFGRADRAISGNSTTAQQLVENGLVGGGGVGAGLYLGGDAESAGLGLLASLLLKRGGGAALKAYGAKKNKTAAEIVADLLMSPDMENPEVRAAVAKALVEGAQKDRLGITAAGRTTAIQGGGNATDARRSLSDRLTNRQR